jgi:HSP20 family protein
MLMRPYRGWMSSWREMERLRREMNRLLEDWPGQLRLSAAPGYPALNLWTNEDSAVVTAELPGVSPDQIDISVEDDVLAVRGRREPEALVEGVTYHRRERLFGAFARTLRLPFRVDAGKVEAVFANGVLSITLPRAEADKPKKIAIRAG